MSHNLSYRIHIERLLDALGGSTEPGVGELRVEYSRTKQKAYNGAYSELQARRSYRVILNSLYKIKDSKGEGV